MRRLWTAGSPQGEAGFAGRDRLLRSGPSRGQSGAISAQTIAYHAAVAEGLGWQLEAYEGGQHVVDLEGLFGGTQDPAQTEFFIDLVRRPEFEQLYLDYFNIWRDAGGGLMAQFSDFGAPNKYGSWGIWDSVSSPNTPRADAVEAFRDGIAAWWDDARTDRGFRGRHGPGGLRRHRPLSGRAPGRPALRHPAAQDRLIGRTGGRTCLDGGGGNDELWGGTGSDRLIGGGGRRYAELAGAMPIP